MSTQNKGTQDLNEQELKETAGNGALGNDSNTITGLTQGYANGSNMDDNGDTSSTGPDFGNGSLPGSQDGR